MQLLGQFWSALVSGFGLVNSEQNAAIYPLFVVGCVIALLQIPKFAIAGPLASLRFIDDGWPIVFRKAGRAIVGSVLYAGLIYGLTVLYWFMLLPHAESTPVCPGGYQDACGVVSVAVRTIITIFAVLWVFGDGVSLFQIPLNIITQPLMGRFFDEDDTTSAMVVGLKIMGRFETLTYLLCFAVLFYSWQVVHWPALAVAIAATWYLGLISTSVVSVPFAPLLVDVLEDNILVLRIKTTLIILCSVLLLSYAWLFSGVSYDYGLLVGIYLILVSLDGFILSFISMFDQRRDIDPRFLNTMRFPFVASLITIITVIGASGILVQVTPISHVSSFVWIAAGAGAAAYALFQPLSDAVRLPEYSGAVALVEDNFFSRIRKTISSQINLQQRIMRIFFGTTFFVNADESEEAPTIVDSDRSAATALIPTSSQVPVGTTGELQVPVGTTGELEALITNARAVARAEAATAQRSESAYKEFNRLAFPAYFVFFISVVIYYMAGVLLGLPAIIASSPLDFIGHSLPVVISAFSAARSLQLSKRVTNFSFFLLFFTLSAVVLLVVTNLILSNAVRLETAISSLTPADSLYWIGILSGYLEALATFLVVGHIFYLVRILAIRFNPEVDSSTGAQG